MYYVSSVRFTVSDLGAASAFLQELLDFEPGPHQGEGWIALGNGALSLRVELGAAEEPLPDVALEILADDLDACRQRLTQGGRCEPVGEPFSVAPDRLEQHLRCDFGLHLVLIHQLSEDELDEPPPLPIQLLWDAEICCLVQGLLKRVPLAFRASARERVTRRAEALAIEQGGVEVALETAMRGFIQVTPAFQLDELRSALVEHGVDTEAYSTDFEPPTV